MARKLVDYKTTKSNCVSDFISVRVIGIGYRNFKIEYWERSWDVVGIQW